MNAIKIVLFVVSVSVFSKTFVADNQPILSDDFSGEESGIIESGWQNHLSALWQDKYWDLQKGTLKEQWINSAIKAAMNENISLKALDQELKDKLIKVINEKFKTQTFFVRRDESINDIVKTFEQKLEERQIKKKEEGTSFLFLLKKISTDIRGNLDSNWKKTILKQIKDLIQLSVNTTEIIEKIENAIKNYNLSLSFWQPNYAISDEEKEGIVDYIKDMEIIRDFQLQQLSTSGLQELIQSDITQEQNEENRKVQRSFKSILDLIKKTQFISNEWQKNIVDVAKDHIDIYQNPQVVVDKINDAFDQRKFSSNKGYFDLFSYNDQELEKINQIKNNIMKGILFYLHDYQNQSKVRKAVKINLQQDVLKKRLEKTEEEQKERSRIKKEQEEQEEQEKKLKLLKQHSNNEEERQKQGLALEQKSQLQQKIKQVQKNLGQATKQRRADLIKDFKEKRQQWIEENLQLQEEQSRKHEIIQEKIEKEKLEKERLEKERLEKEDIERKKLQRKQIRTIMKRKTQTPEQSFLLQQHTQERKNLLTRE